MQLFAACFYPMRMWAPGRRHFVHTVNHQIPRGWVEVVFNKCLLNECENHSYLLKSQLARSHSKSRLWIWGSRLHFFSSHSNLLSCSLPDPSLSHLINFPMGKIRLRWIKDVTQCYRARGSRHVIQSRLCLKPKPPVRCRSSLSAESLSSWTEIMEKPHFLQW
jgi:hypothetical protein